MGIIDRIKKGMQRRKDVKERREHYQRHGFTRQEARKAAEDSQRKAERDREYKQHYDKIKSFRGQKEADEWSRQWKKKEAAKERRGNKPRKTKDFFKSGNRGGKASAGFGGVGFGGPGFGGPGSGGSKRRGSGGVTWGKGPF